MDFFRYELRLRVAVDVWAPDRSGGLCGAGGGGLLLSMDAACLHRRRICTVGHRRSNHHPRPAALQPPGRVADRTVPAIGFRPRPGRRRRLRTVNADGPVIPGPAPLSSPSIASPATTAWSTTPPDRLRANARSAGVLTAGWRSGLVICARCLSRTPHSTAS